MYSFVSELLKPAVVNPSYATSLRFELGAGEAALEHSEAHETAIQVEERY